MHRQLQSVSVSRVILVCQNRTCRRQGSAKVLEALEQKAIALREVAAIADIKIQATGCLGQCGNGPMMLILPEETWYCGVKPAEIPIFFQQHLIEGKPVFAMLYRKFHPKNSY